VKPVRSIAFVINSEKAGAAGLGRELVAVARARGVRVRQTTRNKLPRGFLRGCDACCVIGGDGTLLGVVRESAVARVPLIGVNCGSLGFLTPFSPAEARSEFDDLLQGGFRVDYRAMLECRVAGRGSSLALNDILIKDEVASRLVHIEVFADGELVTDYLSDGLIFATATGSTAYNLSAGGPIVHPKADVIAMTPICPHTLSNRTIMFRDTVKLRVFNRSPCPSAPPMRKATSRCPPSRQPASRAAKASLSSILPRSSSTTRTAPGEVHPSSRSPSRIIRSGAGNGRFSSTSFKVNGQDNRSR